MAAFERCRADMRDDLQVHKIPGAIIATGAKYRKFAVYDAHGALVPESKTLRHKVLQYIDQMDAADIPAADTVDDDVIFTGLDMRWHFGHFLVEGLNRLWPLVMPKYNKCKIVFPYNQNGGHDFVRQLLGLVGVSDDRIMIIDKPTRFRNVYVPDQSFRIKSWGSRANANMYRHMAASVRPAGFERVYVSREKMGARRTIGEEKIRRIFARNGFHVAYPETMSVADQVALMANCRVLAGCAGTALHLSAFMSAGGTVIMLKRNSMSDDAVNTQIALDIECGHKTAMVAASVERRPSDHWSRIPQIIGVNEYVREFFDAAGFAYDAQDLARDAVAWRQYRRAMWCWRWYRCGQLAAKYMVCVLPTRRMRHLARKRIQKMLHVDSL